LSSMPCSESPTVDASSTGTSWSATVIARLHRGVRRTNTTHAGSSLTHHPHTCAEWGGAVQHQFNCLS
jgi:hypothetical protein